MRASLLVLCTGLAIGGLLQAQCGDPYAKYFLMNATHDRIWVVDLHDSRYGQAWQDLPLQPSQSASFDGALTHLKVRLSSGGVLEYGRRETSAIRARPDFRIGDWIIDHSGLRFISCRERQQTFEGLKKYEWSKP
jgi:hypothetical protein